MVPSRWSWNQKQKFEACSRWLYRLYRHWLKQPVCTCALVESVVVGAVPPSTSLCPGLCGSTG